MEGLILLGGVLFLTLSALLYVYLIETKRIQPHTSRHYLKTKAKVEHEGNFWDAESRMFYKWDELIKLSKERKENKNDTVS